MPDYPPLFLSFFLCVPQSFVYSFGKSFALVSMVLICSIDYIRRDARSVKIFTRSWKGLWNMSTAENWVVKVEDSIKMLEDLSPEDRLQLVDAIKKCWLAVQASQNGWLLWLNDVIFLNQFPKETLHTLFAEYRKQALDFLKFDIDASNAAKRFMVKEESQPNLIV